MDVQEIFLTLGMEPTKDEKEIRNAYRAKLAVTNPEDDPEGFKRLRAAYEAACQYAKQAEDEKNVPEAEDTTPSGLWMDKIRDIYQKLSSRRNTDLWVEILKDDILQSLEEEEECREKLLRFLMDHFRLPTEVWKLLDEKMGFVKDASRLRERFPADFINFVVNRCERGEDIDFTLFEGAEDANYDLFFRYYDECWNALQEKNFRHAEQLLSEADGLHIYHPAMEVCRGELLFAEEKKDEAAAFMEELCRKHPGDTMVNYNAAEIFWSVEKKEEAAQIFERLKAENDKHYMSNVRLAEWYYETGRYKEAKKCAESVLASGAEDTFMKLLEKINSNLEGDLERKWLEEKDWESALELCWCYLQDGKVSRGIRLAGQIKEQIAVDKQTEYNGLLTKLHVEQADFEETLSLAAIWEQSLKERIQKGDFADELEKDEDRIRQSHLIRMQCYRSLGYQNKDYFAKAIQEIESVSTGSPKDIPLWLEKAQIYVEMEEYEKCLELTSRMIEEYQVYAAAATAMEAYRRQWDAGGVIQNAQICIRQFPGYIRAYDYLGRVYLDLQDEDSLRELLEEAKKNKVESPFLEAYEYHLSHKVPDAEFLNKHLEEFQKKYVDKLEDGEMVYFEKGLPILTEYLYWYPGAYMLRRRAAFYMDGEKMDEALADLERALIEEPGNAYIHSSMGRAYLLKGDYEKALIAVKKAILYGETDWVVPLYHTIAKLHMLLGDNETALIWFEQYDKLCGEEDNHRKNLAECLARLGRTEEAARQLELYYRKKDGTYYNGYHRSQTNVFRTAQDDAKVKKTFEEWKKELPAEPSKLATLLGLGGKSKVTSEMLEYYDCMAWSRLEKGDWKEALDLFEREIKLAVEKEGYDAYDGLTDLVFAAALYGQDKIGKKYAEKLQIWLNRVSRKAADEFAGRPKARLMTEFLAKFYTADVEQLQKILDREKDCIICSFCTLPRCQELEGMRVLLLLKQGKMDEVRELVEKNLLVQPFDEYMRAAKAAFETGVLTGKTEK